MYLIGDIHGSFVTLKHILRDIPQGSTVVQVGDFGFWPHTRSHWDAAGIDRKVYFIDGNHDYHPAFREIKQVSELWPNAFFIPRSTVMEIEGKRVLFLGGAASVDKAWRHSGIDWFPDETITLADVDRIDHDQKIDVMITHTPPQSAIDANFDPMVLVNFFELSPTWRDPSAQIVQSLWDHFGNPPLICGHMHRRVQWRNVTILNVNDLITL